MKDIEEIFDSAVRTAGDLAGVFEFDGDVSYFYLYATIEGRPEKVLAALHLGAGPPDFDPADLTVRWNPVEDLVGVFVSGKLRAAFDVTGKAYGPPTSATADSLETVSSRFTDSVN